MATLEYISNSSPPQFKSIGIMDQMTRKFGESSDFPIGTVYTLGGKFPLNDYMDLFDTTGVPHTLDNVPVKLIGFDNSCQVGQVGKYGSCQIMVKKMTTGGRSRKYRKSKKNRKNKSRRFK